MGHGEIDRGVERLEAGQASLRDVAYHAHDLARLVEYRNALAHGIIAIKEQIDHALIHQDHRRGRLVIGLGELAAALQRDLHRGEIIGIHAEPRCGWFFAGLDLAAVDGEVSGWETPGARQHVHDRVGGRAGETAQLTLQLRDERTNRVILVVLVLGECYLHGEQVVGVKTEVHRQAALEQVGEHAGSDQDGQRHGELDHDEHVANPPLLAACRPASDTVDQRPTHATSHCLSCRRDTEGEAGKHRKGEAEGNDRRVERRDEADWNFGREHLRQEGDSPNGKHRSQRTGNQRQHHRLGQQLSHDAALACPKRHSNGNLLLP